MAAAAEKRLQNEDNRGMKDAEGYKRKLEQREKAEQQANLRNNDNEAPLKVRLSSYISFSSYEQPIRIPKSFVCLLLYKVKVYN